MLNPRLGGSFFRNNVFPLLDSFAKPILDVLMLGIVRASCTLRLDTPKFFVINFARSKARFLLSER